MIKKYWHSIVVVLAAGMGLLVGLLYLGWSNNIGLALASGLHLPALRVNQTTFAVGDILADARAINTAPDTKDLTADQKQTVLEDKLKQEGVVDSLIRQFKLQIDTNELADLQRQLLAGADDKPLTESEVKQTFGYSLKDFTRRVAVPFYNRTQLQKYFIMNTDNADKTKITELRETLVKDPASFDAEAKKISGQDAPEHIVAASDLTGDYQHITAVPVGGISSVVANADGYRLYKVVNIITDDTRGNYYQLHELFWPTTVFQEKMNQALSQLSEHWYIKKPQVTAVH